MSVVPAFRLEEAGFSRSQVEALSEFMNTEAARRSDLHEAKSELKSDIQTVRAEAQEAKAALRAEIQESKSELRAEIQTVRAEAQEIKAELGTKIQESKSELKSEFKSEISSVKSELSDVKSDVRLMKWMIGFILAFQAAIFAKLFMH